MQLFHCPFVFRSKPYGCGFGPCNATQAFLDYGSVCPRCGKTLKRFIPPRAPRVSAPVSTPCAVRDYAGRQYCDAPAKGGLYCSRHGYLTY